MKLVFLLLFTVICKSGIIYEYDGTITELYGKNKNEYYFYELEYPSGAYLYVSNSKDSVWFGIEGNEIFFDSDSEEFEIQN